MSGELKLLLFEGVTKEAATEKARRILARSEWYDSAHVTYKTPDGEILEMIVTEEADE